MRLGLPVALLAGQVRTLTLGTVATRLREKGGDETDIRVRLRKEDRVSLANIKSLPINLPMGGTVPLKEVADFVENQDPVEIQHEQQTRLVHVYSNREGRDLNKIIADVEIAIAPVVEQFPLGYSYEIGGENKVMTESFRDLVAALVQAGMDRVRPILITAFTTIFGMLPMALSTGVGAEMKDPMALTVIGGLITATMLTLFYVPIFYSIADHISYKSKKKMIFSLPGQEKE